MTAWFTVQGARFTLPGSGSSTHDKGDEIRRAWRPGIPSPRPEPRTVDVEPGYFSFQVSLSTYTSSRGELMTPWSFKDMPTVSLVARR